MRSHPLIVVFLALVLVGLLAEPAHAYADPGTGLFFWQLVFSGVVGVLFSLRRRIARWVAWRKERNGRD